MSTTAPRPTLAEPQVRRAPPSRGAPPPRRLAPDPTVPALVGRAVTFTLLALFAGLHWMALPSPGEQGRAFTALLICGAAACGLVGAGRLNGRRRALALAAVTIATLVLAMLAGGVPAEMLRPSRWSELAAGIQRGIEALPGITVPYKGVEPWIRIVMPLGGTMLMAVAGLAAFWPRRDRVGRPGLALLPLVVLFVVPAIALSFGLEYLRGALFAVLVVALLRSDRLRLRDGKLAASVAAVAVLAGLIVAPAIDSGSPWWDYESWAENASSSSTTSYSWNHTYGPLDWPRDGREMLRVKAKRPAYWKAENLDGFDGLYWRHVDLGDQVAADGTPPDAASLRTWTQDISVTVGNLRSTQVITGGYTSDVAAPTLSTQSLPDGTFVADRPLKRGDAYRARIYSPQPSERQRRTAPATDDVPMDAYLRLSLQTQGRLGEPGAELISVQFPRWGTTGGRPMTNVTGTRKGNALLAHVALTQGPYAGVYRLAQRLKRGTRTEEDYVQAILRYLALGFSYSEVPPTAARTLPGFLLDAKIGYCQQFSGSMALLLRMGGVPARVSTGFTSGALDIKTKEYVVRDLDAHSWVEVWYPDYGWITFDPTPASAPPRAQPDEAGTARAAGRPGEAPNFPGDAPSGRSRALAAVDSGTPWWEWALIGVLAAAALGYLGLLVHRGGHPAPVSLDELERALRRTGRAPGPGTTLASLERSFVRTPSAAGYVRAVREARYAGRPAPHTPRSARRGLRAELGRGGGLLGRLRAWWALPPHR